MYKKLVSPMKNDPKVSKVEAKLNFNKTMTSLKFTTLDVFTDKRYAGNPLAIVALPPDVILTQEEKQLIAREFNLSETVILHMPKDDAHLPIFELDIFIVNAEIRFAGHPTIGTIFMLQTYPGFEKFTDRESGSGSVMTKAGEVKYTFDRQAGIVMAEIPHDFHIHQQKLDARLLNQARGKNGTVVSIVKGMTFVLIELDEQELEQVSTSNWLRKTDDIQLDEPWYTKGTLLGTFYYTKRGNELNCRMIMENTEDPATGSASCALSCFLALQNNPGSHEYQITQGLHMGRKSDLRTRVVTDGTQIKSVVLGGTAVQVMKGSLQI